MLGSLNIVGAATRHWAEEIIIGGGRMVCEAVRELITRKSGDWDGIDMFLYSESEVSEDEDSKKPGSGDVLGFSVRVFAWLRLLPPRLHIADYCCATEVVRKLTNRNAKPVWRRYAYREG